MEPVIRFLPSRREVCVPIGTSLLEAARRAGLPVASACSAAGACGRCGLRIVTGAEAVDAESASEQRAKQRNRIDADLRLACRIDVTADMTVTTPYW